MGFSIGALVARKYASLYSSEIAGMVIVDHAFLPTGDDTPTTNAITPLGEDSPPVLIYKTPIDLTTEESSDFYKLSKRVQVLQRWADSRRPALATAETAKDCLAQVEVANKNPYPLGGMPLLVISTGNNSPGYGELQQTLLSLSSNSKQLIAERSFHSVEIDQPEVVISGIRQVLRAVRGGTRLK